MVRKMTNAGLTNKQESWLKLVIPHLLLKPPELVFDWSPDWIQVVHLYVGLYFSINMSDSVVYSIQSQSVTGASTKMNLGNTAVLSGIPQQLPLRR